jgi:hypothetical protein
MRRHIGNYYRLIEMPQHYFGNPDVTLGMYYKVTDVQGFNFWLEDNKGNTTSFHSSRFDLDDGFVIHGTFGMTNSIGFEVQISDDGSSARLRGTDGVVSDWIEIEHVDDEDEGLLAIVKYGEIEIPLNQVMRV